MMKNTCKSSIDAFATFSRDFGVHVLTLLFLYSRPFFDRRMGQEINGEVLGEDYKGYIFRINGGND